MNLFSTYSYITNIGWGFLDLMPPFIRTLVFKIALKSAGKKVRIDYKVYIRYMNHVCLGNNVSINRGCKLIASHAFPDVRISIGNNVALGPEVILFAAGHDYSYPELPNTAGDITIGDNVWIGGRSVILQSVTIGEGAVVAAGSVVTKNVEPYTVVAGVPARKIKDRTFITPPRINKD